jgi:hypothetical protein
MRVFAVMAALLWGGCAAEGYYSSGYSSEPYGYYDPGPSYYSTGPRVVVQPHVVVRPGHESRHARHEAHEAWEHRHRF